MRTLRLSLVGTVTLMLLGVPSGASLAQEESDAFVTGTISCNPTNTLVERVDDTVEFHQIEGRCTMEMSDPRVSGFTLSFLQQACFKEAGDACLSAGTVEIVPGPDGRWVGTWGSVPDATLTADPTMATLEGTGIYEGWTFWFQGPDPNESDAVSGIIFKGPPPPWSDSLPLAPAE